MFRLGCLGSGYGLRGMLCVFMLAGPGWMPAAAQTGPDVPRIVKGWLDQNRVRIVAVDFITQNCPPCERARPFWQAMQKKYRSQGFRLVVVPDSIEGQCANVGWTPDETTRCDPEGHTARAFGVTGYPQAFVWSWDGKMLVQNEKDVHKVEKIIARALREMPRVTLQNAGTTPAEVERIKPLIELLHAELSRTKKLQVMQGAKALAELRKLKEQSHDPRYSEKTQCNIGTGLAPNSLLRVGLFKIEKKFKLKLDLEPSTESCSRETAMAPYDPTEPDAAIEEATQKLLFKLTHEGKIQMPTGRGTKASGKRDVQEQGTVTLHIDNVNGVHYDVDSGLRRGVLVKGQPTTLLLGHREAAYTVLLQKEGYHPIESSFQLTPRKRNYNLYQGMVPRVVTGSAGGSGVLVLRSEPSGAEIFIDNQPTQRTTPAQLTLAAGQHAYTFKLTGYGAHTDTVRVMADAIIDGAGKTSDAYGSQPARVKLVANFAPVQLRVFPNDADLYINGKRKQLSRGIFVEDRMMAGGYKIEVHADLYHSEEATLFVKRSEELRRTFKLRPNFGRLTLALSKTLVDGAAWPFKVYLNGALREFERQGGDGATMTAIIPRLRSGTYELEVRLANYKVWRQPKVTVSDMKETQVNVRLDPNFGLIHVTSEPSGLEVQHNGTLVPERTPLNLRTTPGTHSIRILNADAHYQSASQTVEVEEGTKQRLHQRLKLIYGKALITTEPAGAVLWVDGKKIGPSPQIHRLLVGRHTVSATKEGWTRTDQAVDITHGKTTQLLLNMTRMGAVDVTCDLLLGEKRRVQVILDGQTQDGPSARFKDLTTGVHTVTCTVLGGIERSSQVTIRPGHRAALTINLGDRKFVMAAYRQYRATRKAWILGLGITSAVLTLSSVGMFINSATLHADALNAQTTFDTASSAPVAVSAQVLLQQLTQSRDEGALIAWSLLAGAGAGIVSTILLWTSTSKPPDLGMDVSSHTNPSILWQGCVSSIHGGLMVGVSGTFF